MPSWFRRPAAGPMTSVPAVPPPPSDGVTRDLTGEGWHVRLDLAPQVLSLDIPNETTWREGSERLEPTCPRTDGFVSASMLAIKAKLFDDGLYAAAEIAAQAGKAELLTALADVATPVAAAAHLGGLSVPMSNVARGLASEFLADALRSKPLGFYTWSDPLRRIFQQDRLLQQPLTGADAAALTAILRANPTLQSIYDTYLNMVAQLTNPLVPDKPDLRQPGGAWFFPPSRSHEGELIRRLYGDTPIPDGFSLAEEMVRLVRAGSLPIEPTSASGWYDWQTWALEPLACLDKMPEGARVQSGERYCQQLEELFKAVLSLTRETHVKQLKIMMAGMAMGQVEPEVIVWVAPGLTVEPVRTYYERRARGYEFVREALETLGPLKAMRRQTSRGAVTRSLDEELAEVTTLFGGAAAVVGEELGMERAKESETRLFREWAKKPDVAEDVRMMVPAFYDIGRQMTKVWMVLGWSTRQLRVQFSTPPDAHVLRGNVRVNFGSAMLEIAYPVFAEAYVSRLLDRDEFRAHCDRHQTRDRILEHL